MTHLISPAKACRECKATRVLAAVQSAGGTKWRDVGRDGWGGWLGCLGLLHQKVGEGPPHHYKACAD
jgi:hypothetical protein